MRLLASLILLTPLIPASASLGQEPFRVNVSLVGVAFSVRDARGALVDNLTKEDFDVLDDAIPQNIAFFARSVDVPLTLGLILDVSGSQEHFTKKHQHDLEVFLKDVLGPKDRVFLVGFANHVRLVSDFSHSSSDLMDAWHRYEKDSGTFPEIGPPEKRELGTAFYDSIYYSVTEKLAKKDGRRALLVFSDGEDNSSSHDMMTTIETAQGSNVLVFTIRYTEKEHGKLTARNRYGISVMDRIAKETGGEHIDAEKTNPHAYFQEIASQLRTSYELGYYPAIPAKDNTFHKIIIRPKQPGLEVRAKTGYFSR